jgi:hypothetical protein
VRQNLMLAFVLAVQIGLLVTNSRQASSKAPPVPLLVTCRTYGPDDTSTCGSGTNGSENCATSQVTHVGTDQGPGMSSITQTSSFRGGGAETDHCATYRDIRSSLGPAF